MQEMDCIEVTVEKEKYARHGVHKGMQGWICDPRCINEAWLVNFPQCGEKEDIAEISINEEDLKVVKILDAQTNEQIKAQFEGSGNAVKELEGKPDDLSGYMI